MILTELLEHKPLMTAGYLAVLHIHTVSVECEIENLISEVCWFFVYLYINFNLVCFGIFFKLKESNCIQKSMS